MPADGGAYTVSVSLPAGSRARWRSLITVCSLRCVAAVAEVMADSAELARASESGGDR
jgi:hypothetical protein